MFDPTELAISRLKLDALDRQRAHLAARYADLRGRAAAARDDRERLRILVAGLAPLRSGAESLHPLARLLEPPVELDPDGALTGSMIARWCAELERELDNGVARADHMVLFARLIDEWLASTGAAAPLAPEAAAAVERIAARACAEPPAIDEAFAGRVLDGLGARGGELRGELARRIAEDVEAAFSPGEVMHLARALASSPYRSRALRVAAARVAGDPLAQADVASALDLRLGELDGWRWESPVALRPVWARDRHRVYLDEGLLDALFLHAIGVRLADAIKTAISAVARRRGGLLDRPGEDAHLTAIADLSIENLLKPAVDHGEQSSHYLRDDEALDEISDLEWLIATVSAWAATERAARPERPFVVVRGDVAELGPNLPHAAALQILEWLEIPERWRSLVARALAVPLGGEAVARRGVFPDQALGLALCDLVLWLADLHVSQTAGVRVARLLDDVVIASGEPGRAARGWAAWTEAVDALGLELQPARCGAVAIGGATPAGLPPGPVRLGLLELGADGVWRIDDGAVDGAVAVVAGRLAEPRPVLELAARHASGCRDLLRRLAPFAVVGDEHWRGVAPAIARAEADAIDALEERIAGRFGQASSSPRAAWLWPLSAGGFGLFDAASQLAGLQHWRRGVAVAPAAPSLPAPGKPTDNAWLGYLRDLRHRPRPRRPELTAALRGMMADFVDRGRELRGEDLDDLDDGADPRHELAAYWQWLIALRGPELVERFGSFRMVDASRVPLTLVARLHQLA